MRKSPHGEELLVLRLQWIHILCVEQVVDRNDFDVRALLSSAESEATDTAKTVNTYFDSHNVPPASLLVNEVSVIARAVKLQKPCKTSSGIVSTFVSFHKKSPKQ